MHSLNEEKHITEDLSDAHQQVKKCSECSYHSNLDASCSCGWQTFILLSFTPQIFCKIVIISEYILLSRDFEVWFSSESMFSLGLNRADNF
jgi:hypothetical protein